MAVKKTVKIPKKTEPERHGGYTLLQPWTTKGAGTSKWSFAEKGGREYFIKEFLNPVLPEASSGMSAELIERKKARCAEFEKKKMRIYETVNNSATGNIVKIEDFFFDKTKFYLTTLRVEGSESDPVEISALPQEKKMLFIRVLANSMVGLHKNGVVHGDLKTSNVLVKKLDNGNLVAKLIDFGESFLEGESPNALTGDVYISPEARRAMEGEDVSVGCKADVFALGLMFHEYYTGEFPSFDPQFSYAHEALLNDAELTLSPKLDSAPALRDCVEKMLRTDPAERPTVEEVFERLKVKAAPPTPPAPSAPPTPPKEEANPTEIAPPEDKDLFHRAGDL